MFLLSRSRGRIAPQGKAGPLGLQREASRNTGTDVKTEAKLMRDKSIQHTLCAGNEKNQEWGINKKTVRVAR